MLLRALLSKSISCCYQIKKMQPKACVKRIIPQIIKENIRELVRYYDVVPVFQLTFLYYHRYDEVLDACRMGFDTGLIGLLQHMPEYVKVSTDRSPLLTLTEIAKPQSPPNQNAFNLLHIIRSRKAYRERRNQGELFDKDNKLLWNYGTDQLLDSETKIIIVDSPYELLQKKNPSKATQETKAIRKAISIYANGLYVHQLSNIHKLGKVFFNVQSIGQLVTEYPELFYHQESNQLGVDDMVFDGSTKTYCDFDDLSIESLNIDPYVVAFRCLQTGLYQKTLILIKHSSHLGLKLAVWFSSLEMNFQQFDKTSSEKMRTGYQNLLKMQPLHMALALDSFNLIRLRAGPEFRNDLRLHLPPKDFKINQFLEEFKAYRGRH